MPGHRIRCAITAHEAGASWLRDTARGRLVLCGLPHEERQHHEVDRASYYTLRTGGTGPAPHNVEPADLVMPCLLTRIGQYPDNGRARRTTSEQWPSRRDTRATSTTADQTACARSGMPISQYLGVPSVVNLNPTRYAHTGDVPPDRDVAVSRFRDPGPRRHKTPQPGNREPQDPQNAPRRAAMSAVRRQKPA